jgi:hypothetical protein
LHGVAATTPYHSSRLWAIKPLIVGWVWSAWFVYSSARPARVSRSRFMSGRLRRDFPREADGNSSRVQRARQHEPRRIRVVVQRCELNWLPHGGAPLMCWSRPDDHRYLPNRNHIATRHPDRAATRINRRRRQHPAVPRNDLAIRSALAPLRDQHRHRPTPLPHRRREVGELIGRVRPRIPRIGGQPSHVPVLDQRAKCCHFWRNPNEKKLQPDILNRCRPADPAPSDELHGTRAPSRLPRGRSPSFHSYRPFLFPHPRASYRVPEAIAQRAIESNGGASHREACGRSSSPCVYPIRNTPRRDATRQGRPHSQVRCTHRRGSQRRGQPSIFSGPATKSRRRSPARSRTPPAPRL